MRKPFFRAVQESFIAPSLLARSLLCLSRGRITLSKTFSVREERSPRRPPRASLTRQLRVQNLEADKMSRFGEGFNFECALRPLIQRIIQVFGSGVFVFAEELVDLIKKDIDFSYFRY